MKKIAISILAILLFSTALPLASAVTETQFSDGSSTFTHVFSTAGDAATQGVTLPFGAEVSDVEFEIEYITAILNSNLINHPKPGVK